jgi:hypothetical protein
MLEVSGHKKENIFRVRYSANEILGSEGNNPHQLLLYNPNLNLTQDWAASHNVSCNLEPVKNLCTENFKIICKHDWIPFYEYMTRSEQGYKKPSTL